MQALSLQRVLLWLTQLMAINPAINTFGVVKRLALIYLLAHGGIFLLLNAVYWDDWILFKAGDDVITKMFHEANPFLDFSSLMHIALLKLGPWPYRLLSPLLLFFSGIFLWGILSPIAFLERQEKYEIVVLFMVLPLYAARVTLISLPSAYCYFSFFLGWWLLTRIEYLGFRLLALGLFMLSFRNNALLVFYALPIIYLYYLENGAMLGKCYSWLIRRGDFLVLPLLFFTVQRVFFPASGHYSGYNEINTAKLLTIWVPLLLVLLLLFLGLCSYKKEYVGRIQTRGIWLVSLGLIVLYLGILPYMAVGKMPRFYDWNSRFQFLMPLGVSIATVGIISILKENFKLAIILIIGAILANSGRDLLTGKLLSLENLSYQAHLLWPLLVAILAVAVIKALWKNLRLVEGLVVGSILVNLFVYIEYAIDWQKQEYVIAKIAASEEARNASTIIVDDQTTMLNARGRELRFYEYAGWFKTAFGDEKRLGLNLSQWLSPEGRMLELLPKPYDIATAMYLTSNYNDKLDTKLLMTIRFGNLSNIREPLNVSFQPFIK